MEHRRANYFDKPRRGGSMCPKSGQPWARVGKATEDLCGEHQAHKSERRVTKAGVPVRCHGELLFGGVRGWPDWGGMQF